MSDFRTDAKRLARILIRLQQLYPLFFKELDPNDPDFDLNIGFPTFDRLMKQHRKAAANE